MNRITHICYLSSGLNDLILITLPSPHHLLLQFPSHSLPPLHPCVSDTTISETEIQLTLPTKTCVFPTIDCIQNYPIETDTYLLRLVLSLTFVPLVNLILRQHSSLLPPNVVPRCHLHQSKTYLTLSVGLPDLQLTFFFIAQLYCSQTDSET